ncbi:DUF1559 domain-containing protein [Roseiconus lacunae]|uniref:DUF1559 domain-containing protein n=1 Tax=Roseiconus lacunae TaxID=2605694 RepID=A0ABT7PQG5_9BACT|nr:DUF1559 domain-containing protein [Roseiconus lacunae]MDM4018563.1 DUF1559 domain-containing protein [Roseiconus lacunae]
MSLRELVRQVMPRTILIKCMCVGGLLAATALLPGCSSDTDDLFMKAASRPRGNPTADATPEVDPQKASPQTAQSDSTPSPQVWPQPATTQVAKRSQPEPQTGALVSNVTSSSASIPTGDTTKDLATADPESKTPQSLAEQIGIKPLSERLPAAELSDGESRRRTVENMIKIFEALEKYAADHQSRFPPPTIQNEAGIDIYSWRVELLPYLGYPELYDKFDRSKPWNLGSNKELLQYIPEEYVTGSGTRTNIVGVSGDSSPFFPKTGLDPSVIQDGSANTLLLVEIDDSNAPEWTEPAEFFPTGNTVASLDNFFFRKRGEGFIAMWANGLPTFIGKSTDKRLIEDAFFVGNDNDFTAGQIHQTISFEDANGETAIGNEIMTSQTDEITSIDQALMSADSTIIDRPLVEEKEYARMPVPNVIELRSAQERLKKLFADKIRDAKTSGDKVKLAREFLQLAGEMTSDPAGAFALQQAAIRMAIDAEDTAQLLQGVDQRVAQFEVDALEENLKWFQAFGESTASRSEKTIDGDELIERTVPIVLTAIRDDEYMRAASVCRVANRYTGGARFDKVSRILNRLRGQLGLAKRDYDESKEYLDMYRSDPDNVAAGAAFGRFACFIKGDWKTGLQLIADGPQNDLREVARMDLQGAGTARGQVAIGDAWWELSKRASGAYRQGAQDRAVKWYEKAVDRLPESLDKIHVTNRLQDAHDSTGTSPISLCIQLGDLLGVDISQSLTSIAVEGSRGLSRDDDDD